MKSVVIFLVFALCSFVRADQDGDQKAYSDSINVCRGAKDVVTATTGNCTVADSTVARGFYKNEVNSTG